MPFSNRIKNAAFDFQGKHYQLRASSSDGSTQHGDVRDRPWRRSHQSKNRLEYELDTTNLADFNFPFPFLAGVRYALDDTSLVIQLSLRNEGIEAMPAGFGMHPYFRRYIASSPEVLLQFSAEGLYEVDSNLIPSGVVKPPLAQDDFSEARAVGKQHLNHLYRHWSKVSLHWPGVMRLELTADPVFKHLVVFTHEDGSLAVEPVTNATDGFNLLARGIEGHGVVVLEPGETLEGTIAMTLLEA
jgi:aldose 1-epimerase